MKRAADKLKLVVPVLLIVMALFSGFSQAVMADALSPDQITTFKEGIYFFDTTIYQCNTAQTSVNLTGNDNVQKVYNYFVAKGLSGIAAAGIVGNMMQESGVNPQRLQGGTTPMSASPPLNSSQGWGIVQWTGLGVQQNLVKTAAAQGRPVGDLAFQLDFLFAQLNSNPSYYKFDQLKAATNPSEAAMIFHSGFERSADAPGSPALLHRQTGAEQVYQQYGGAAGTASSGTTQASAAAITCGTTVGNFATNFVEYKQCNYGGKTVPWASTLYGNTPICESGCGPSAMAMIITNLTGQKVTPDMTAAYGAAHGTALNGGVNGSSWNLPAVVGGHWGLSSRVLGADISKINDTLKSGGLVLATGLGPDPFTTGGHFIVIRAITADGKWLTGNSAGYDSSKAYDPQQVILSMQNSWALTKG